MRHQHQFGLDTFSCQWGGFELIVDPYTFPKPVRFGVVLSQTVFLIDEVLIVSPMPVRLGDGLNMSGS